MSGFTAQQRADIVRLFGAGRMRRLEEDGVDFAEGAREGAFLFDTDGRRYIDCIGGGGTYNLGRRNPDLIAALRKAIQETDQGNFPMISREKADLAAALAHFVGSGLQCAVFAVVRGETVDFACKSARGATRRTELISVSGAWHGETGFAMTLSDRPAKNRFGPLLPGVRSIPFGDMEAARQAVTRKTAMLIIEPVQVENHCRCAAGEYLRGLRQICSNAGTLLCFDETQTGFGRTGRKFAFEESGALPDMLILGEALGGGIFPIAAVLQSATVHRFMNAHPLIHLSTFGGSDVGCRVALKALEIYEQHRPWENGARMGERLQEGLARLTARYPAVVRSVSGAGLACSIDCKNPETAVTLRKLAANNGVIVSAGRVCRSALVLRPSLLIDEAGIDAVLAGLDAALQGMVPEKGKPSAK